jgi:hypothetical protein
MVGASANPALSPTIAISDSTEMGIVALLVGVKIPKSSNFVVFM